MHSTSNALHAISNAMHAICLSPEEPHASDVSVLSEKGRAMPENVNANRYTADAQRRAEALRAMAEAFPKLAGDKPLTSMEIRLARHTPIEALESAAILAEATPQLAGVIDVDEVRDVIMYELAYDNVRGQAVALARHIEHAILRRKLKAVKAVRALYRMAKVYSKMDAGDPIQPHVQALKHTLVRRRRKKSSPATEEPEQE